MTSIWASMDIMVWWYPGYCTARCRAHGDPVVEIPHYYSPRAPEREREHDPLTHSNHPGGRRNMMVRANICPSIYQRTDAQTFWSWGESRASRPGAILAALHTRQRRRTRDPPTGRPSFFRNHVANGTKTYLLNPFPAPTPLSNNNNKHHLRARSSH